VELVIFRLIVKLDKTVSKYFVHTTTNGMPMPILADFGNHFPVASWYLTG